MKTKEMIEREEALGKRIESYWDARSPKFSAVRRRELEGSDAARWQKFIASHLPEKKPLRILDVGTGAGFFVVLLTRMGHEVTGIDMSAGMIDEAQKNLAAFGCRADLRKMNAQQLDFSDEFFDVGGMLLNFDSDYGKTTFSAADARDSVHTGIGEALLIECNKIKDELRVSTHRRPLWDADLLEKLGFSVQYDADIASLVHGDESLRYDDVPLFGIYAKKVK